MTPRSLPEEWQPQFIDQYDGSFACTKDGETLRETPPESEGALRQVGTFTPVNRNGLEFFISSTVWDCGCWRPISHTAT